MGDSFAERLRRLEDAEQIRQLNLAYRRHLDRRDLDAYGRLFADDGEWLGGTGYGQGPAGITAMLTDRLAGNPAAPGPTSMHVRWGCAPCASSRSAKAAAIMRRRHSRPRR